MKHFTKVLFIFFLIYTSTEVKSQVNSSFVISYQGSACNPAVVNFINSSTGQAPLYYNWNFGVTTGTNSLLQNPATTYINCGSFTVRLIVMDGTGMKDTSYQQVNIHCSPSPNFSLSPASGCYPLAVQFTSSTNAGSGNITSLQWDFGDGTTSGVVSPNHNYTTVGCKNVTLIATNSFGCLNDTTIQHAVCVTSHPNANFTSPSTNSCAAPFNVSYNSTSNGGTAPYTYQWSFPGGNPTSSTAANPTVIYNASGNYNAQLIITDANGCTDTLLRSNWIHIGSFVADFGISSLAGCVPATINVNGFGTPNPASFSWNVTGANPSTSSNQNESFSFANSGSYQICLTATFSGGCVASKCTTVVIHNRPTASFVANGNFPTCSPPLNVQFQNTSSGNITSCNWTFTGGIPSNFNGTTPPQINYSSCGNYPVQLQVVSNFGCADTIIQNNVVNINCPAANFIALPSAGCAPLMVSFNSGTSTGMPTNFHWNFGDPSSPNNTSTQANPVHVYNTPGCYNVLLITGNGQGCGDTILQQNVVCVGTPPQVNFTANPTTTCAMLALNFTNLSTGVNANTTYAWDFHNVPSYDVESSAMSPLYQYADTGWWDVTLIACNNGCCDTLTVNNMVHILPPVAIVKLQRDCNYHFAMKYDGTNSIGADSYQWTFLGGTPATSTDSIVTVVYNTTGNYVGLLTVTNNVTGCTYTSSKSVMIRDVNANFTATPLVGCAPLTVCMNNTTVDGNSYSWLITNSSNVTVFSGSTANPCPTISTPGLYSVRLIATDVNGCKDTLLRTNYITVYGYNISFTSVPSSGCVPLNVGFTDQSTSPNSIATSWLWHFGDVSSGGLDSSTNQNPFHTYIHSNYYDVTLSINDNHGCTSTRTITHAVHVLQPVASFSLIDSTVCFGNAACVYNYSSGNALTYVWNFGDGNFSSQPSPCHGYTQTGSYNITLLIEDGMGCKDTINHSVVVNKITAAFTADTTHATCPILSVHFTDQSIGIDSATTYYWSFGDGSFSTLKNPAHLYTVAGLFDVQLVATNLYGCSDTMLMPQYIQIGGPTAQVNVTPNLGCAPLTTCFYVVQTNSTSIVWNFGDGVVMPGPDTICYNYSGEGIFHPEIIITNGYNCTYAWPLDSVIVANPHAHFVQPPVLCSLGSINFSDSSYGVLPIQNRQWNFGDPVSGANNFSVSTNPSHFYSAPGSYLVSLTVYTLAGCSDVYTDTVFVTPPPVASFTSSVPTSCQNVTISFNDVSQSQSSIASYLWNFGDAGSGANNFSLLQNPLHLYNGGGNYTVTEIIQSVNGCSDTVQHLVTINSNPNASAGGNQQICANSSVQMGASGGVSYSWTPISGLSNPNIANPIASPSVSTTYTVHITDANGCSSNASAIVHVNPLPSLQTNTSVNVCVNAPTQLMVSGAATYSWLPSNGLSNPNISNPVLITSVPQTFNVTGTSSLGCSSVISISVNLFPVPVANAGVDAAVCLNNNFQLNGSGGNSYSWMPTTGLSNPNIANPMATPQTNTNYVLTVTDANGCHDKDTVIIYVNALPVANAGPDQSICANGNTTINATGGISYQWTPSIGLSSPNASTTNASPQITTTYTVHISDGNGCANTDQVVVTVNALPNVNAGNSSNICLGNSYALQASGASSYSWMPANNLSNPNISNPVAAPGVTTTFTVTGTDANGCMNTDTVSLHVLQNPVAAVGPDVHVCSGDSAQLQGSGGSSYVWTPTIFLSANNIANPIANPTTTIQYQLLVVDSNGCQATDSIMVFVNPLPNVHASAFTTTLCLRSSTLLNAVGAQSYFWNPDSLLSDPTIYNPVATPVENTFFRVVGTDVNGCKNVDSVLINVIQPFQLLIPENVETCAGDFVQLNAGGAPSYYWSPAYGLSSTIVSDPIASPAVTTTYTLMGTDNMCFHDTAEVKVTVHPTPHISAGQSLTMLAGESVDLNATADPGNYKWSPENTLSCVTCLQPTASPEQTTTYNVEVTDNYGCRASDSVVVYVFCNDAVIFVPNAFTPNEDGKNDKFYVRSNGLTAINFFRVYDRWGQLIFETNDLSQGWDGSFNGQQLSPDVYVYHLSAVCTNGDEISKHGNVTLIR